jgi:dienelactone hydrolase
MGKEAAYPKVGWKLPGGLAAVALALVLAAAAPAAAGEREVTIPLAVPGLFGQRTVELAATEYRPDGDGPFPAIVLSHGSTLSRQDRARYTAKYPVASEVFVAWNLVVLSPLRRGYGKTGGHWEEDYGACASPAYAEAGLETARDIAAAVAWLAERPYVDRTRIVLVGQSGGGWGSLAAASRGDLPIVGVVNFAGGRGGKQKNVANNNCAPERLVEAAGRYGRTVKVPSLWLYAENDQFFAPSLSHRMYVAYTDAGAPAAYHLVAAVGRDGHQLIALKAGIPLWKDAVESFLRTLGVLPPR